MNELYIRQKKILKKNIEVGFCAVCLPRQQSAMMSREARGTMVPGGTASKIILSIVAVFNRKFQKNRKLFFSFFTSWQRRFIIDATLRRRRVFIARRGHFVAISTLGIKMTLCGRKFIFLAEFAISGAGQINLAELNLSPWAHALAGDGNVGVSPNVSLAGPFELGNPSYTINDAQVGTIYFAQIDCIV